MPIIKINKTLVDNIPMSDTGQMFYWDANIKGFGIRVGKSSKAYFVEKRINGKTVRVTIGKHGQITAIQARQEAQKLLGNMTIGRNPTDEKQENKTKMITLVQVYDEYMQTRKNLKKSTIDGYKLIMRNYFHDWHKKSLVNISKDMVSKRHEKIEGKSGAAQANHAMRFLRAIFYFAMGQYEDSKGKTFITENPVKRLSQTKAWYEVKRRNTVIKSYDLPALFAALEQLKDTAITSKAEVVRDYIILLLFTGLRRQEAAKLKWEHVDFKDKTFTVVDTKNNEPLTLPLSVFLYDLLKTREEAKISDYVFPGEGETGHIVEPRRQIDKVKKLSGISFTIHDLRRTFITIAESLDISSYSVKRLVNHKMSGDVTAGYIIHDVERLRKPMQQITDYILEKAGIKTEACKLQVL